MLSGVLGLLVIVAIHTAIATVMTRFFRVRLETRWGVAVFSLFLIPLVLSISLLVVGQLPIDVMVDRRTVLLITILLPTMLGIVIDLFWLPSPEDVELRMRQDRSG